MRSKVAGRGLIATALGLAWIATIPAACGQNHPSTHEAQEAKRAARLAERNRLWKLAHQHAADGDHAAAVAAAEQMAAIEISLFGESDGEVAKSFGWIGAQQYAAAEYEAAAASYDRQSAVLTSLTDAKPWQVVDARYAAEEARTRAALAPVSRAQLEESDSLLKQASELYWAKKSTPAIPLAKRALEIRREVLGPDHASTAAAMNQLALNYEETGAYDAALPLNEQAVATATKAFGEIHPMTASYTHNLGYLCYLRGDYARAEKLFETALAARKQTLGPKNRNTAVTLCYLGRVHAVIGNFARASELYGESVEIFTKLNVEEDLDVAVTLHNLASLNHEMGDDNRAIELYERALAIKNKVQGEDHPDTATTASDLAMMYEIKGDYSRALALYEQVLATQRSTLGDHHHFTATTLHNLAVLHLAMGDDARALSLEQQSLDITRAAVGDEHPSTAVSVAQLGQLHRRSGDYSRALLEFQEALAINRTAYGDDHLDTADMWKSLGTTYAALGQSTEALASFHACADSELGALQRELFSFGGDRIQALLTRSLPTVDYLASLPQIGPNGERRLLEVLLSKKAVEFQLLALQRAAAYLAATDPEVAGVQTQLNDKRGELEALALRPPPDVAPEQLVRQRRELQEQVQRLDDQLSRALAARLGKSVSLAVSLDDVLAALPRGAAHIEYFRYHPYEFQAKGVAPRWLPPRYAAFVISPNLAGSAKLIDLGPADDVDRLIDQLSEHVAEFKRFAGRLADEAKYEDDYRAIAASLSAKLFAPLAEALDDARRVSLGPDGRLHELAFEALVDASGKYLIEDGFQFAYVNSGRDLLRQRDKPGSGVAVFASPDYSASYQQRLAMAEQLARNPSTLLARSEPPASAVATLGAPLSRAADTRRGWRDLGEAALAEGEEAAAALAGAGYGPLTTFSRGMALEEAVKRLVSPRVLVLITHGDFLTNEPAPATDAPGGRAFSEAADDRGGAGLARRGLRTAEDPFLRSYLVLAGANEIDEQIPADVHVENGWLTAQEIAQLDLRGTELVVLSACSTNRGDANNGQAVMGMRSALLFAGARTIVGSLFEVPNAETRRLLKPFYEGVAAGEGKLASLNAAKRAFINERRSQLGAAHPFFWASFVLVGEP